MTSFLKGDRSQAVGLWLVSVAALVVGLLIVGGATRLTDSGLSITEWRPATGIIPPLSAEAWAAAFGKYQQIPQYQKVNPDISLDDFKVLYWWEWTHRFVARLVGLAYAIPFAVFLIRGQIPRRLIAPLFGLLLLGVLQAVVGWWMVASGLSERVSVAPERLALHLGLALALFSGLVWCALEAAYGQGRMEARGPWARGAAALTGLIFIQALLGALVAGNDAGMVFNDWPLMNGRFVPEGYGEGGLWTAIAHDQGTVQFHHRMFGYLLFVLIGAYAGTASRSRLVQPDVRTGAFVLAALTIAQVALGVATLMAVSPIGLGLVHQALAVLLLGTGVALTWRARRL